MHLLPRIATIFPCTFASSAPQACMLHIMHAEPAERAERAWRLQWEQDLTPLDEAAMRKMLGLPSQVSAARSAGNACSGVSACIGITLQALPAAAFGPS